ncbi:prepilin-type N-terminal cleavage/methylation domain-containing protein [Microbacterium sp. HD4P20]|uniref:type IV pilus modification PilV family protein n=1 Tax=Microbacterium sp. HD4P20 TaxID=2864874 RepID=UPI001C6449BC|nr:prepilin-type N-terminal cleavage/methylation domain-containing protein [Microbacterium sp. HD4P20]MCP2637175.1 prepilin-type N-terminal cleavage/methylation domain-containing protein [Microbacterium sp. HD4P20]
MARHEEGFSLVEVIIAMFLLMVLALAVLPLTIGAARTSVVNRNLVAATALASAQLAPIKAGFGIDRTGPSRCSELAAQAVPAEGAISDPAGTGLSATVDIGACPTDAALYPATVAVTVEVLSATGLSLVAIPTLVLVSEP